ncbi:hypothetical protein ACVPOS_11115 [Staphylococcus aureus]
MDVQTCIGNSGPLLPEIEKAIADEDLLVTSVLSGNRNFEVVSILLLKPIT